MTSAPGFKPIMILPDQMLPLFLESQILENLDTQTSYLGESGHSNVMFGRIRTAKLTITKNLIWPILQECVLQKFQWAVSMFKMFKRLLKIVKKLI